VEFVALSASLWLVSPVALAVAPALAVALASSPAHAQVKLTNTNARGPELAAR
jgi:hypothetical protein